MQSQIENDKLTLTYSPRTRVAVTLLLALVPVGLAVFKLITGTLHSGDAIGLAVAFVIGLAVSAALNNSSEFVLDKASSSMSWKKRSIFKSDEGVVPFADIQHIKVVDYRDAESSGASVVFVISSKELALIDGGVQNSRECERLCDQITQFIKTS